MLCCVSRRAVAGADQGPPYDHHSSKEQPVNLEKVVQLEQSSEPDVPPILLPCAICARTFMPQSLEKHSKICERSTNRKRKPFDSAKQRIQGTELAEFLPRQEKKRRSPEDRSSSKPRSTWKETHDDFLRAIRAARNEVVDSTMQKQCGGTTITPNAPTRANEQGMCPTCNRHFGVKAYDRHVAWCKERITRVSLSPATNIAKERLEARMKYRAPAVKSRRQATREKYSPGSAINLSSGNKTSPTLAPSKAKESASAPSCNKSNDSPVKQKSTVVKRPVQTKEFSSPGVSMKSRLMDRINRQLEDEAGPTTFRSVLPVKRISHLPVPPLKYKRESFDQCNSLPSPKLCKRQPRRAQAKLKPDDITSQRVKQDEKQASHSARSLKANIVSARSQGHPKVNDVSINNDIVGITVKPCNIYKENQLTTWKQIVEADQVKDEKGKRIEDLRLNEKQLEDDFIFNEDVFMEGRRKLSYRSGSTNSLTSTPMLNQTYSLRDLMVSDKLDDMQITKNKKWKPVKHSPRIEFCLGDPDKTNQVYVPPISPILSGDMNRKEGTKNSRKNLKEENFKSANSKYCPTKDEGMTNEAGRQDNDLYFQTFRVESPLDSFKSSRSRILERKGLKSTTYADISVRNYTNSETMESPKSLHENNTSIDTLNTIPIIKEKIPLNYENTYTVHTNEDTSVREENVKEPLISLPEGNLYSVTSYEQFANLDELNDFCEISEPERNNIFNDIQEANHEVSQMTLYNDRPNSETNQSVYIKNIKTIDDEFDFDTQNSARSFQNEFTEIGNINDDREFYNSETNWNEIETDPYFMEVMLQPTRSSTPFINVVHCTKPNFEDCEDYKQDQCQLPMNSEWKEEIDTRTGSEVLYRVESRDSNYSSSDKIDKLGKIKSKVTSPDRRSAKFNKNLKNSSEITSPVVQKENKNSRPVSSMLNKREDRSPRNNSSMMQKDGQIKFPKIHKKEIASQINICKCSVEVFPSLQCERGVGDACIHTIESTSYSEPQVCSTTCNKNMQRDETAKESSERQKPNFNEANFNTKPSESSINQINQNQEVPNCKKKFTAIKGNMVINKTPKILEELTVKDDTNNEVQEIYSAEDFNCNSDNSIDHQDTIIDFKSSSKNHNVKQSLQSLRSIVLSESCVKLSQRIRLQDSSMSRSTALKSRRLKTLGLENSIHARQVDSVEVETIEEIGTRNRSIRFRVLPKIKGTTVVTKEDYREKGRMNSQTYWEKASKASRNRLINLDPPYQGASRFLTRNPKVCILPPVPSNSSLINHRNIKLPLRPVWSNYVRRRPDFNLVLSGRTGKDYDPFLLAEQQMNDLLSDTSEQSVTDSPPAGQNRNSSFPLSHSSAFIKYPCPSTLSSPEKRSSLIAPPSEFDDLMSDFSSDSTETNSLSREVFLKDLKDNKEFKESISRTDLDKKSPVRELGRRVIIDKSKALGGDVIDETSRGSRSFVGSSERARKILDKVSPKVIRPTINRSISVRASSAPKVTPDRNNSSSHEHRSLHKNIDGQRSSNNSLNSRNNNYTNLSSSNLSLSSIMSSDVDIKRSNSVFDELMTSFEDENGSFPSLKSFIKNDSLSSPVHGRQRNGQISDEELSSPESYKRQDHNKMSGDSAYSSLNRKYSHHGRSTNDVAGRFDEESRSNRRDGDGVTTTPKCKMSKFCHECGSKFPETAKYCCECGIRRLVL
ncbi:PREDICTED: uncharacterized protein LOC108545801 [Eufriesea mexicana]|uniref:uncharacterized protein LOC108545801 n=1 Tax=Eufriesea mexicana TaxID=516756 RepID=UPI00083C6E89|nr:PREDICTED: uncharacterized protein LOC108545801 [Eufriesea mexicana]